VHGAALAQALAVDLLEGADQARVAVGDAEEGRAKAALAEVAEVGLPAVEALGRAGAEVDEDLATLGGDAPGAEDRLPLGGRVVLKKLASANR